MATGTSVAAAVASPPLRAAPATEPARSAAASLYAAEIGAAEWAALAERSANVFNSAEWLSVWWRHFGAGRERMTATWRGADGRASAIAPLYRVARGPLTLVRFVGHGPSDQLGPICAPEDEREVAAALSEYLAEQGGWDVFLGERLPARRDWTRLLGGSELLRDATPTLTIEGRSWEDYLTGQSANFRQQLRRRERKLAREHGLRYRLADDPARLQSDLDILCRLHAARWEGHGSGALEGRRRAFHREFAALALERGWLRLWFLELEGRPLAAWYGLRYAGVDSFYQAGRDPRCERQSVGLVLLAHTIRDAMDAGSREYRFLRGAETYKSRFTSEDEGLQTVAVGRGPRGRLAVAGVRAARSMPPAGRRMLTQLVG